jgi:hypothetical protein
MRISTSRSRNFTRWQRRSERLQSSCCSQTLRTRDLAFSRYSVDSPPWLHRNVRYRRAWPFAAVALVLATQLVYARSATADPQLTFVKVMQGSVPSYEKIVVRSDGSGHYHDKSPSESPRPLTFRLSPAVTAKFFSLAARLHDFKGIRLESHKRVANLGEKTFQYENGGVINQVEFNYSLNRTAQELSDLFESLGSVERHIESLNYAMRYDPLGLPGQLELIQVDLDNKSLVQPELMASTLDEIVRNRRYMHLAQVRAENILQQIQDKK